MQCPYCNKEMKLGSIDVYDTLSWSPEGERRKGPSKYSVARNGIVISKYFPLTSASKEAFYCSSCKKIIIDVE
ncbi:PF20097 family protein [Anaerocolumna sp.]|uniref:PF20097 family protein n=1 Tax=Anaerocolumna sp. TaxID=2041569 RepID=UPI0028ADD247|nr:PF20097 family protein [Anaerocolumna sp.]